MAAGLLKVAFVALFTFHAQALVSSQVRRAQDPSPQDILAKADAALADAKGSSEEPLVAGHAGSVLDLPLRLIAQVRSRLTKGKLAVPRDAVALVHRVGLARQEPEIDQDTAQGSIIGWLLNSVIYGTLVCIVAFGCYTRREAVDIEAAKSQFEGKDFTHGPFSCFDEPMVCLMSCCCPAIKWADNMNSISFYGFGVALCIFLFFQCTADLILITWLAGAAVLAYNRQKMRTTFGMKNDSSDHVSDYCMWLLCCWCATAQETRHLAELTTKKESA
jgi:Cys-rich protein (TIGR01571 family)